MGFGGQVVAERTGTSGAADASLLDSTTAALTSAATGPRPGLFATPASKQRRHDSRDRDHFGDGSPGGFAAVLEDSPGGFAGVLEDSAAVLEGLRESAPETVALFDAWEAADFAGRVEDLSRTIGYLQILAAHAIERTREEAKHAPKTSTPGWRTGWTEPTTTRQAPQNHSILDDGYRNAAEFLRARLRIGIREARRRLSQAALLLPGTTPTGQPTPPRYEHLAHALANTNLPSASATIITTALDTVARIAHPETLTTMEHTLTRAATETDPDFLAKTARRWIQHIDHDGPEPTEEELRTIQGAFLRKPRRGLHHIEIFATDEQYETLTTLMNTATNPRLTHPAPQPTTETTNNTGSNPGKAERTPSLPDLDRRSRAQKLLDGLVTGCQFALKTGKLPANGGLKPQVTVTIDHRDLYNQLTTTATAIAKEHRTPKPGTGTGTFTGPLHPTTIRKIACDADILPVLLGTNGQILDIGQTSRIFPPHIRKALNARDQGCTFPNCTIPAPWCEAHHITYWSQGGPTSTNNAALLCSHHHHLIHKEQWKITTQNGVPWYTPPPHLDPSQTPQRNHHNAHLRA